MIKDFFSLIAISIFIILITLLVSFVHWVVVHNMVDVIETNVDPSVVDWSEFGTKYHSKIYAFSNSMQVVGIICLFGYVIASMILVSRVRFTPLAIPFALISFFVGLFISMAMSNVYYFTVQKLIEYDSTFTVNTYMNWIGLKLPQLFVFIGGILLVLAYAKAPYRRSASGGGLEVV